MTPWQIAERLLEVMEAAFADDLPPRCFVSDGTLIHDWTPVLAVEWVRNEPVFSLDSDSGGSAPADMSHGIIPMRSVFEIHISREAPMVDEVGTPPPPSWVHDSAERVHADAWKVLLTLLDGMRNGTFAGWCTQMHFISQGPDNGIGPTGEGSAGSVTTIAVGYYRPHMDKARRASVIRMAARYVEQKDREPGTMWAPLVRITRLDAQGNPTGESVECGPMIVR